MATKDGGVGRGSSESEWVVCERGFGEDWAVDRTGGEGEADSAGVAVGGNSAPVPHHRRIYWLPRARLALAEGTAAASANLWGWPRAFSAR